MIKFEIKNMDFGDEIRKNAFPIHFFFWKRVHCCGPEF